MTTMGITVTAVEAAFLVNRNERNIREKIKQGILPAQKAGAVWVIAVADLEQVPGWRVSQERCEQLIASGSAHQAPLAVHVQRLFDELRALHDLLAVVAQRVAHIEQQLDHQPRPNKRQAP